MHDRELLQLHFREFLPFDSFSFWHRNPREGISSFGTSVVFWNWSLVLFEDLVFCDVGGGGGVYDGEW